MIELITKSKPARWVLSGTLLAGIACAVLAASATAGAQTAASTTPRCKTPGLEVWLGVGAGGGQAGSIVYPLEFTNVSGHTCHLYGFPGVSAEVAGNQVGSAAGRDHSVPARTVTLRNRATAHSFLQITDVSAFPPASCKRGHRRRADGLPARCLHRGPDPVPVPGLLGQGAGVSVGEDGSAAGRDSRPRVGRDRP